MTKKMKPRATRWLRFKRWLGVAPLQGTCVWCPRCGNEMVSCPRTKAWQHEAHTVRYECGECSLESAWDFGPPAPIMLWSDDGLRRDRLADRA